MKQVDSARSTDRVVRLKLSLRPTDNELTRRLHLNNNNTRLACLFQTILLNFLNWKKKKYHNTFTYLEINSYCDSDGINFFDVAVQNFYQIFIPVLSFRVCLADGTDEITCFTEAKVQVWSRAGLGKEPVSLALLILLMSAHSPRGILNNSKNLGDSTSSGFLSLLLKTTKQLVSYYFLTLYDKYSS